MTELTHTKQAIQQLKNKYPIVFKKFLEGTADLSTLSWLIDNLDGVSGKKLPYKVIKETELVRVLHNGKHIYKT